MSTSGVVPEQVADTVWKQENGLSPKSTLRRSCKSFLSSRSGSDAIVNQQSTTKIVGHTCNEEKNHERETVLLEGVNTYCFSVVPEKASSCTVNCWIGRIAIQARVSNSYYHVDVKMGDWKYV